MHLTRLRAFAVALMAICLLSACTSDPTKTTSPTPPPTPAPSTTTATPKATATPSKAGPVTPDVATLRAAAKAYFAAYNQAIRDRDTTAFRRTFTDGCKICAADAADLDRDVKLGQTLHGGEYHMAGGTLIKAVPRSGILLFSLTQEPSTLVDKSGKTLKAYQASDVPSAYLEFKLINHKWIAIGSVVG